MNGLGRWSYVYQRTMAQPRTQVLLTEAGYVLFKYYTHISNGFSCFCSRYLDKIWNMRLKYRNEAENGAISQSHELEPSLKS
jgi:hypothetical protein